MDEVDFDDEFENSETESEPPKGIVGFFTAYGNVFMISLAAHAVILFLVSLIGVEQKEKKEQKIVVAKLEEPPEEIEEEEEPEPEIEVTEPEVTEEEVVTESEVVVEEEVVTETISEITEPTEVEAVQAGTTDLADAPPAIMGVGSGSPAGGGLPYGYKSRSKAGRKGALARYGGGGTISAVDLALKWLAEHQEYDGSWDQTKYEGHYSGSRVGISSVALLAFLGAGYSETVGPFKKTVRKGISWLNQKVSEGGDQPNFDLNYGTAMALMALSEATIFGSKPVTRENANKLVRAVGHRFNGKGWRYASGPEPGNQDLSVSSWIALGLKSAKAAELEAISELDLETIFDGYKSYVEEMTVADLGQAKYDDPGGSNRMNMGWIAMFSKQFLGYPKSDSFIQACAKATPGWIKTDKVQFGDQGGWFNTPGAVGNPYGIYYGTIAAFQHQGEMWQAWNASMKKCLLEHQHKGDPKVLGGSWDPTKGSELGDEGGRVLMTALMALCLEVYYRYEMMN